MLPNPKFYNQENAGNFSYFPNDSEVRESAMEFRKVHNIKPSSQDKEKIVLLSIDMQGSFCYKNGSLYVGGRSGEGAIQDQRNMSEFIYRNLDVITQIVPTMDTHIPYQIFFSAFWLNANNEHVAPHTTILSKDIENGTYRPSQEAANMFAGGDVEVLTNWCKIYCDKLALYGKYELYIWPEHALLGSKGHALSGLMHEASMFHSWSRDSKNIPVEKGNNPLTEHYSVFKPEVEYNNENKVGDLLFKTLLDANAIIIGGEAGSHCVKSSIQDLFSECFDKKPDLIKNIYIMKDCMSAVVVPGVVDYTEQMESALNGFARAGMNIVNSTDDIRSWPNFPK